VFVKLVETRAHTRELRTEVTTRERAHHSSQYAHKGGVISLTDLLDADRQLLAAKDELAPTCADAARAAVSSFRALGRGWSTWPPSFFIHPLYQSRRA
jgi:outer membrane protein TolC